MKNINRKWLLTVVALLLLAPAASAIGPYHPPSHRKPPRQHVPESGSALVYVLGSGMTCLGAMFLRSRFAKPEQS
jgi:hypothetical protein